MAINKDKFKKDKFKVDRSEFSVSTLHEEDKEEIVYWKSKTPHQRL
jgi:hypothetical protein